MSQTSTLADLTACCKRSTGSIPRPLVGASTTILGNHLYVFGGRLANKRKLTNELYSLELSTLIWERIWPAQQSLDKDAVEELEDDHSSSRGPLPRYFHSCVAYQDSLLIFGGMANQTLSRPPSPAGSASSRTSKASKGSHNSKKEADAQSLDGADEPQFTVLGDLVVYNTITRKWAFPNPPVVSLQAAHEEPSSSPRSSAAPNRPSARYAHLAVITNSCLCIIGGQDMSNRYLQECSVLDLQRMVWIQTRGFDAHVGSYRSIAVSRPLTVHAGSKTSAKRKSLNTSITNREEMAAKKHQASPSGQPDTAHLSPLVQLSYSLAPAQDAPEPIWLFSNFTFSAVKRSLDMISAPRSPNWACTTTHLSHLMSTGSPTITPPGLRFPSAGCIGHHLVIGGTFLSQAASCFALWALDLSQVAKGGKLHWQKIDPGTIMGQAASWNKAVFHRNSVILLGDRDRDIVQDYDHRQCNFNHVAFIDLESFGIYMPPLRLMPPLLQEMGLHSLATPTFSDFEIHCADGKRLACNRKILESRWIWFRETLESFQRKTREAFTVISNRNAEAADNVEFQPAAWPALAVTPRQLDMPESSAVVFSALQYFYTLSLCTPMQLQTSTLVGLLLFARNYNVPHLRALVVHALHNTLGSSSAAAAACYEASILGGAYALQVRSLKRMMVTSSSRRLQKEQSAQGAAHDAQLKV